MSVMEALTTLKCTAGLFWVSWTGTVADIVNDQSCHSETVKPILSA